MSLPEDYRNWFIANLTCHLGLWKIGRPTQRQSEKREKKKGKRRDSTWSFSKCHRVNIEEANNFLLIILHDALPRHTATDVDESVRYSEQSMTKYIRITIETRADYCLNQILRYGCTRVEIGTQSVYEDVARHK